MYHVSIMKDECLSYLKECNVKSMIDCNLGEGGHSAYFLNNLKDLNIIGLDCDSQILEYSKKNLSEFKDRIKIINSWADRYLSSVEKSSIDCVFFDLGISMFHYKASNRAFSFSSDDKLDMRLCEKDLLSAWDVVNRYSEEKLASIIRGYSDEKKYKKIAKAIVNYRKKQKINTAAELRNVIKSVFNPFEIRNSKIDVATKTFQAIRIEVNSELTRLSKELDYALDVIKKNGIVLVITFHSLEDRIVKYRFREAIKDNNYELLVKKPLVPSQQEIDENPASRSAKLRVIRRIA